jgi:hypothetical protein
LESILYVETNLIVGIAKGQDVEAARLVEEASPGFQLFMPSVCHMEALSTWVTDKKSRERFHGELERNRNEVNRDKTSPHANELSDLLEQCKLNSESYLDHTYDRLVEILGRLSEDAEFIELSPDAVQDSLTIDHLDDPTDNLILCVILRHARANPDPPKAFLSGNTKDFGRLDIAQELKDAGVNYLRNGGEVVGWLRSLPNEEPDSPTS